MMPTTKFFLLIAVMLLAGSCSNVNFRSPSGDGGDGKSCEGSNCPSGSSTYFWYESKFGLCSKPCGGGSQTQTVECRRSADNVAVPDSYCTGSRPASVRACNLQACTAGSTHSWNWTDWGDCDKTCGGGTRSRQVVCQVNGSGAPVADSFCSSTPKPSTTMSCATDACTSPTTYKWEVTPGVCSVQCGGGTATDTVVCKKSDGSTVGEQFCSATPKPPTTRTCGTDACPNPAYTYTWEPQAWGICSKECGDGTRTRSVACKRNDGVYVDPSYCPAGSKPATQEPCKIKDCPAGRPVTQTTTVNGSSSQLDVILVVDDSASMAEDQKKLADRLIQFVDDLDALNIDYQICLTTTDIGYYAGSPVKWSNGQFILNKATPNKVAVFKDTVTGLGAEYSSDEQGIKATYLMIRDFGPNSGAKNSGCFRAKSALTVIEISDEDERSVGGNQALSQAQYKPLTPENQPDNLIAYVHSTFDSANFVKPFIWNSIIVKPGDNVCEATQDAAGSPSFPGVKLAELSTKTNGAIASICDADYAANMKLIKDRVVNNLASIQLQCVPVNNPVVTLNPPFTTQVTRTGDQLKFNPALPENTQVTITYTCPN